MGLAEIILIIFVICKLFGVGAAATMGWGTIVGAYAAFYGIILAIFLGVFVVVFLFNLWAESRR